MRHLASLNVAFWTCISSAHWIIADAFVQLAIAPFTGKNVTNVPCHRHHLRVKGQGCGSKDGEDDMAKDAYHVVLGPRTFGPSLGSMSSLPWGI